MARETRVRGKVKCSCEDCACMVDPKSGVESAGGIFCSEECAEGHLNEASCGHGDCMCSGGFEKRP